MIFVEGRVRKIEQILRELKVFKGVENLKLLSGERGTVLIIRGRSQKLSLRVV